MWRRSTRVAGAPAHGTELPAGGHESRRTWRRMGAMKIARSCTRVATVCALILASAAVAATAPTPGKIEKEKFTFGDRAVTYYLYVPKGLGPTSRAPMVVLLHGSGHNGSSLVEPWKDLADQVGVILVGPESANTRQWKVPDDGPAPLCALVDELRKSLPVDARRI